MELSKGGCRDFVETVCYIRDPEIMDDDPYTQAYSHLEFKHLTVLGTSDMVEKII
jgi:hypothetical protein